MCIKAVLVACKANTRKKPNWLSVKSDDSFILLCGLVKGVLAVIDDITKQGVITFK